MRRIRRRATKQISGDEAKRLAAQIDRRIRTAIGLATKLHREIRVMRKQAGTIDPHMSHSLNWAYHSLTDVIQGMKDASGHSRKL